MENEKKVVENFCFKMTMVEGKMADPFFSRKRTKKWFQRCPKATICDVLKLLYNSFKCITPLFSLIFILLNLFKILSNYLTNIYSSSLTVNSKLSSAAGS